ncbi:assimilatory sulfite reductase (NADPH) flavoprotein subunit [Rubritalea profundi]|uniref:assimilatory sulfite reductase (NADPH) n=1 Tax=Rubritalea profundi TaxID=1658618 RepID=A0A2S7U5S2_9BACT|nr:assimilatory sulfite reductase (NADPH) flavoprotein subunit [Rubritalea profundi]PQJ29672.1 sulfite reductase [NADPH] flavoprotein, alpha-component [Rubritalea profundi]
MIPSHAPFDPNQRTIISALIPTLTPEQKAWLSGFLAASQGGAVAAPAAASKPLTVLYGTESGNCESLADKVAKEAKKKGFKVAMKNLADISVKDILKFEHVALIVSTWGDGEPPEGAVSFHKEFMTADLDLKGLKFSVLALGDTSYDKFCQTGKDFDTRLAALGAERIADRVDCDVDFDDAYGTWKESLFAALGTTASAAAPAIDLEGFAPTVEYGRKNPFPAEVLDNQLINGEGSAKETIHLELDLEGSGLGYEAGDALAVVPVNSDGVVTAFLAASGLSGTEQVEVKGEDMCDLKEALTYKLDITGLSRAVAKKYFALSKSDELGEIVSDKNKSEFKNWSWGREVVDLLELFPVQKLGAQALVSVLRKLPPRLYSIASSPKAHPGEVHLTVAAVRYEGHGKARKGVASCYIADEAKSGEKVQVYVHKNKNFRLPVDTDKPVIMVGPGTGIAPFRAFIEERGETSAKGDTWLFFGDQRYTYDFLYQLELQDHLKSGALTKLDVAFSRDQPEKVYVQNKMHEQGEEIYKWLEAGAYFYVCGDAERMAKDVNTALIDIVAKHGGKSADDAAAYIDALKKDKRYQRDVY